jgi:steroid delta-isomerase-like uncharacterized protein
MNLDWAKRWLEEHFNRQDVAGIRALYADVLRFEDVVFGHKTDTGDGVAEFFSGFFDPASGTHRFRPSAYHGDERGGVVEWTWEGTLGETDLFGTGRPMPGKTFRVRGDSILRFDGAGRIVEQHDYWDLATVLRQLGALDRPSLARG